MSCYELLEKVKDAKNFKSDSELAGFLGITRQSINGIKKGGGFSKEVAIKISEATKIELFEILLIREMQIETNEKVKKAWEKISQGLGIAATYVLVINTAYEVIDLTHCILC
ncbi:MAG: helix-turn-helix domain-containing protein [Methylococcales bacterium]|nr:helix-turn-helix domain-containing protein [Methylococcales bacterium]